MSTFLKGPDTRLDYAVDWGDLLDATDGDTIVLAEWVDVPAELTVNDSSLSGGRIHRAFADGGTRGRRYTMTSRIATTQGRSDERSVTLRIT